MADVRVQGCLSPALLQMPFSIFTLKVIMFQYLYWLTQDEMFGIWLPAEVVLHFTAGLRRTLGSAKFPIQWLTETVSVAVT